MSTRTSGRRPRQQSTWPRRRTRPKRAFRPRRTACPYASRQVLLTKGEAAFFAPLTQAVAGRYLIMCKVRLADLVTCSDVDWRSGFGGAISQKHVDFVLCESRTTRVVAAIELDDRSHERSDRKRRDDFLNRVLLAAGIAIIRIRAQAYYSVPDIRRHLDESLAEDGLDHQPFPSRRPQSTSWTKFPPYQ